MRAMIALCGLPAAIATWLGWLALALGHLGSHAWLFDLFANFRVQYFALFAACTVALTIARWRRNALFALLGVIVTMADMAPYFPQQGAVAAGAQRLRVVTFNAWHRNELWQDLADYLRASDADVAVLQELSAAQVEEIARQLPAYAHRAMTPSTGRTLAILSRWPLRAEHIHLPGDVTRMSRVAIDWNGTEVILFGAHLSWPLSPGKAARRSAELSALAAHIRAQSGPVLVAGDFNLTPWSRHFERFVQRSGLTDCSLGQGLQPTWPAQVAPLRIRIDHCFVSRHWRVLQLQTGPKLGSDHLPVIADVELMREG